MPLPSYRVQLSFDPERNLHIARVPELGQFAAEGATRAEALVAAEEEIAAQVANMEAGGAQPPAAIDAGTYSGELHAKVSQGLHRELAWQARAEGVDLSQLVGEMLASSLDHRRQVRAQRSGNRPATTEPREDRQPDERQQRPRQGMGSRYHNIMDDRASFIDYVRSLEQGGVAQRPGGGGGPRPGGRRRGPGEGGGRGPGGQGGGPEGQ